MAEEFPIPRGSIGYDHLSQACLQKLRRLFGGGTSVRTLITEATAVFDRLSRILHNVTTAVISVPWVAGDTKPALHGGGFDVANDQTGVAGETYDGSGVSGMAAGSDGVGVRGEATANSGIGVEAVLTGDTGQALQAHADGDGGNAAVIQNTGSLNTDPAMRVSAVAGLAVRWGAGMAYGTTRAMNVNLTLGLIHHVIEVSTTTAAVTLTLPARAAGNDNIEYVIVDVGNNVATAGRNVSLNTNIADSFLDGVTTKNLNTNRATWYVRAVQDTAGTRKWTIRREAYGA